MAGQTLRFVIQNGFFYSTIQENLRNSFLVIEQNVNQNNEAKTSATKTRGCTLYTVNGLNIL